jgi:hypothetical protein
MTDHAWLADAIVLPTFGSPDPTVHAAGDGHIAACPACRATLTAIRSDAATIAAFEAGEPSAWVRRRVLAASDPDRRSWRDATRLLVLGLLTIGALAGGIAGGGALLGLRIAAENPPPLPQPALSDLVAGKPIIWKSEAVLLAADDVTVLANGGTLHPGGPGGGPTTVHGDPGSLKYATLEITWAEVGLEQRINLYLAADASSWWMTEARAYDNVGPSPDWAMLDGLVGRRPLGQPFIGNLDMSGDGRGGPVHVHIAGAVLAMSPQPSYVDPTIGGGPLATDPFAPGGSLHCSGILQLKPLDAERELVARGIRLSWRFEWKTGPNTGYGELRLHAPATGYISNTALGSDGELIVFVEDPARPSSDQIGFPGDCPPPTPG